MSGPRFSALRRPQTIIAFGALAALLVIVAFIISRLLGDSESPIAGSDSQSVPQLLAPSDADSEQISQLATSGVPDWGRLAQSVVQLAAADCEQAGSGTIIGDGRFVLTNSHVLHAGGDGPICETYAGFTLNFEEPPGDWRVTEVVADDPSRDLAVVRFVGTPAESRVPLPVAEGELALGDELTILGYPGFGDSQNTLTFTRGGFSGTATTAEGHRLLKTDALLDSGVSGGAVFDRFGNLVGVATGGFEGDGGTLGAVIPGADVLRFLADHGL